MDAAATSAHGRVNQRQPRHFTRPSAGPRNPPQGNNRPGPHPPGKNPALGDPAAGPETKGSVHPTKRTLHQTGTRGRHPAHAGQNDRRRREKAGKPSHLHNSCGEGHQKPGSASVRGDRHGPAGQQGSRIHLPGRPPGETKPSKRNERATAQADGDQGYPATGICRRVKRTGTQQQQREREAPHETRRPGTAHPGNHVVANEESSMNRHER